MGIGDDDHRTRKFKMGGVSLVAGGIPIVTSVDIPTRVVHDKGVSRAMGVPQ